MFCHKCGTQIPEDAGFCHKCGTKVVYENEQAWTTKSPQGTYYGPGGGSTDDGFAQGSEWVSFDEKEPSAKHEPPGSKSPQSNGPNAKKVLIVIAAVLTSAIVLYLLIPFFREFWPILIGILLIAGLIASMFSGSKEEKIEARKTAVKLIGGVVVIIVVALVLAKNPDIVSDVYNIVQPGASVRGAYLTQYSDTVTIEEAFDNYFDNGKWSTYKSEGYSYVVFTGVCEYAGEDADIRITFELTGETLSLRSFGCQRHRARLSHTGSFDGRYL